MDDILQMKNETEAYLKKTLHSEVVLHKIDERKLSYGISSRFELYGGQIEGHEVIFAVSREDDTPLGYQRARDFLESTLKKNVILVIPALSPIHTHRLVEKGVDFIVPGQRMYMPSFFIDLGGRNKVKAVGPIPPMAQLIALYHLEKASLNGKDAGEVADLVGCSYLTATRALKWLSDNVFPLKTEGRRNLIDFPNRKKALDAIKPFLRNPVIKTIRTEDGIEGIDGVAAGEYALGSFTMLAANGICKAVERDARVNVVEDGRAFNTIEFWMYPPKVLAKDGVCDDISLILSLDGNEDERVIKELNIIKERVQW